VPDLAGALDKALRERFPVAGIKTPATARRGLETRMRHLENALGKQGRKSAATRAAEAAGIRPHTWRSWRRGSSKPGPALLAKLEDAYQRLVQYPKLRRKVNTVGAPNRVQVTAVINWNGYYNRAAYRSTTFANMRPLMVQVIRSWAREGPTAAADTFEAGIAAMENVSFVKFEGDDVEVEFPP
jgi:hypothetical protein